jgi:hypothetical protein
LRFALDAMEQASALDLRAKDVAIKTVEAELDGGHGVFAGKHPYKAMLRFSADAARCVDGSYLPTLSTQA